MNIKNDFYDIVKLFVNQIGIAIFSLVLYTAVGFIEDESLFLTVNICLSVFATLFYFALIYTASWDFGARDKIRVDGGKQSAVKYKGMLFSLVANLPNFIFALFAILFMTVFLALSADWSYSAFGIANLFLRFLNSMFLGILQGVFIFAKDNTNLYFLLQSIGYFVAPIFTVIIAHLGYTLGSKEYRIFGFLKPKQQNKK